MPADTDRRSPRRSNPAPRSGGDDRSTGVLVRDIVTDVQVIVRKEVELAREELRQGVAGLAQAAGAGGAAAVLGLFTLLFLGVTLGTALTRVLEPWLAWLIVSGVFLLLSLIAALIASSRARNAPLPPTRTQQSIQENVQWFRQQLRR